MNRKEHRFYTRLVPDQGEQKIYKYNRTDIPIENSTPFKWELFIHTCAKRFGLTPEHVDNMNLFNASGMEMLVVEESRKADEIMGRYRADRPDSEAVEAEFGESVYNSQLGLSKACAETAIKLAGKIGSLVTVDEKAISKDLSNILPDERMIRESGITNKTQTLQVYRTLYSMSQAIYLMFIGEVPDIRQLFKINPEIYISALSYVATMAASGFMEDSKRGGVKPGTLASYLLENKARPLTNIFFTLDLSEVAPDIKYEEETKKDNVPAITHAVSIHSRMMGVVGDMIFLKKIYSHANPKTLPVGVSPFHKDNILLALIYSKYAEEGKLDWFDLISPLPESMPLLLLLRLHGMPLFSKQLNKLVQEEKTALHVTWKNALRIYADSLHDGVNFQSYIEQLSQLLIGRDLVPKEGLSIQPNEILDMIVNLRLHTDEQLERALNPATYMVPNSYKFRYFIKDEDFNQLVESLREDVKLHPSPDGYRPFFLFVDPDDNSKVERIDIDDLDDPRQAILDQFARGGRAMLFTHISFPSEEPKEPKQADRIIDVQYSLMSTAKEFIDQRIEYGEARLLGKNKTIPNR